MRHVLIVAAFGLVGCGPATGDLAGTVTFQGKKVRSGFVNIVGADGQVRFSKIDGEGRYAVTGIPAGMAQASVTSPGESNLPKIGPKEAAKTRFPGAIEAKSGEGKAERWFAIPKEAADFGTSKLTCEVKAGANSWDIVVPEGK